MHIVFEGGSNPYVKYGMTPKELNDEIIRWSKTYELKFINRVGNVIFVKAKEKGADEC